MAADVLIVDDHQLLAQSLALALRARGVAATVAGSLTPDAVCAQCGPGTLVLLDLQLGDAGDGTAMIEPLRALGATVLVVTGTVEQSARGRALLAGACEVLDKAWSFDRLLDTVLAVLDGRDVGDPDRRVELVARAVASRGEAQAAAAILESLTPREAVVLRALCDGRTAENIATQACLSLPTVRTHIRGVLGKLGAHHQLEAVATARRLKETARRGC